MQVRLWSLEHGCLDATFNGHRSPVSALRFNWDGSLLASGSQDTDIIVWDVAAESGLYKLRGHQDEVTDLVRVHSCWQSSCAAVCAQRPRYMPSCLCIPAQLFHSPKVPDQGGTMRGCADVPGQTLA